MNIFEIAQTLTGALDENFNIKNKSAILQVVTCLEAFKITHESYREVQSTRIIKDLQALRQNKTNDQLLAKRIKNLLRKWKDRLASTISTNSSQPNSPQNISQGSSDTQFMIQHSQSPPNNVQLHQVNGPTSFSNLLPKSQNLCRATSPAYTTPSSIAYSSNRNGGEWESSSSSTSLLGKRKLVSNEIDENSNHNQKKIFKKSIESPSLTVKSNNIISQNPSMNSALLSSPKVVKQQEKKNDDVPKKRGRKKGSRGIDSTLNGIFPDFQDEIQQKIALSAGKRNKTTFELQQMLESCQNSDSNCKKGDILDSSLLNQVDLKSSILDHSVNSDFIESKIEPDIITIPQIYTPVTFDNQIDQSKNLLDTSMRPLTIEEEIEKLQSLLLPIDYEAAQKEIFKEYSTLDKNGRCLECTCTLYEVVSYSSDKIAIQHLQENGQGNLNLDTNGDNVKPEDSDEETDDFCAVEYEEGKAPYPLPMRSAVKSIFDPEYDANENLIEEIVLRKSHRSEPKVIEVKIEKDIIKPSETADLLIPSQESRTQGLENFPTTNYEYEEDPLCPARAHFQRDSVTRTDIESLHNSCVNGINGFWNGVIEENMTQDFSKDKEGIDYLIHRLWKRVVPRSDFLTLDKIPKTFNKEATVSIPPLPLINDNEGGSHDEQDISFKKSCDVHFKEWHEVMNVRSCNDEILTILPYVVID